MDLSTVIDDTIKSIKGTSLLESTSRGQSFYKRFYDEAKVAEKVYGVPAAVLLAISAHESGMDPKKQTLFGVKGGTTSMPTWEVVNGKKVKVNANFRTYKSTQDAFLDAARLIANTPRYAKAYAAKDDPQKMIKLIAAGGYATDPSWAQKVSKYVPNSKGVMEAIGSNIVDPLAQNIVKPAYAADERMSPRVPQTPNRTQSATQAPPQGIGYTIQRGDTLGGISSRYGVDIPTLLRSNPSIQNPNKIFAGSSLTIPAMSSSASYKPPATSSSVSSGVPRSSGGGSGYLIRPGDTLSQIARRLGTTVGTIMSKNPEIQNPNKIFSGKVLRY